MSSCGEDDGEGDEFSSSSTPSWSSHPDDPGLWLYHVETTTSTMDEARRIVEGKFALDRDEDGDDDDDTGAPAAFLVSATSQSNGRGTTNRNWEGSRGGNALFTIGVPQSSWTDGLRSRNDGTAVPLTLLPLKIGSLVAFHTRRALRECVPKFDRDDDGAAAMPAVTVKWPNDVLLRTSPLRVVGDDDGGGDGGGDPGPSHEKIAGVLVETSRDWFLVGIGINVGYAPQVPSEGADRGRKATCLARYCHPDDDETTAVVIVGEEEGEDGAGDDVTRWIEASRKLATDVAYDLHSWLHSSPGARRQHSGESILEDWKSYVDWDMELTLRDTPNRERVTLEGVLEDGRAVVREVETGRTRTLVSDYFL
jgi:biotin-(acetyl-CoA carboxylase) ligase